MKITGGNNSEWCYQNGLPGECKAPLSHTETASFQQMGRRTHRKQTPVQEKRLLLPPALSKAKKNKDRLGTF